MSTDRIIRAWEDPEYRASLSPEERPESPVGGIELTDAELGQVMGAARTGGSSGGSVGCNTCACVATRGNSAQPCQNC
jgi:mersacidin/lichenicidin family type 2 lantibiotic